MRSSAAFCLVLAVGLTQPASADSVPLYRAQYRVLYRGHHLADSEFAVRYDREREHYTFSSSTRARGLLRLARHQPATEQSEFLAPGTGLRPLVFSYDDGSRGDDARLRIVFDWDRGTATTTRDGNRVETPLKPGVLDRGTLQVALMMDMAAHRPLGPYWLVDGDTLERYEYRLDGQETLEVPAGTFETERYEQRHEGSSRSTWIWVAPALDYLAVRIEQRRDGEVRTAFVLDGAEGLGTAASER